jgi:stage II sporulation protein D
MAHKQKIMSLPRSVVLAAALLAALCPNTAIPDETVRVLVMDGLTGLTLNFPPGYGVTQGKDTGLSVIGGADGWHRITMDKDHDPGGGIRINAGDMTVNINEFALSGTIDIKKAKDGRYSVINELTLEDYTGAVVGEEMSSNWPIEALKAQAVIARTYAMYKKKACVGEYDLCSTVNSQVFTGNAREKVGPALAARQTRGEVLTYDGTIIEAVYHSTCGGKTEDSSCVWDRPYPYLKSRDCRYCQGSPYYIWNRTFSAADIEKALGSCGYRVDGIKSIKVADRSASMRVKQVRVIAVSGAVTMKGTDFRRALGYSSLPSTCFEVRRDGTNFVFVGKGSGHGVGLCQFGAKVMAEQGIGYREILAYYYPGTALMRMAEEENQTKDAGR